MYTKFLEDLKLFTNSPKSKTIFKKIIRLKNNPGMKMVLLNRFTNETPKYLLPLKIILKIYYHHLIIKYGIDLPLNLKFGYNLRIFHFGNIIVNPNCQLGNNVTIMHEVTLGNDMRNDNCPIISDNVFIGVGAKIIGGVYLAESIKVGANAVVTKSFYTENITLVGIPAKIIGETKSD